MTLFGKSYRVDWAHLVVISLMAAVSVAYLLDARSVSLNVQNLLLVQPVVFIVFGLYLFILPQCFEPVRQDAGDDADKPSAWQDIVSDLPRVGSLALALLCYVLLYETIGFDVASVLFAAVSSFISGERRIYILIPFAILAGLGISLAAKALVAVPIPTTIL